MPQFDRINGTFTTRFANGKSGIRPEDRFKFKREGWTWDPKTKAWVTADIEKARPLRQYAVGDAKAHIDTADRIRKAAVDASWAETTDASFPAPDGLDYLPFQKAGIEDAIKRKRTLIADPPGLGKSQPVTEPVLTPDGWKPIGDVKVGDFVIGSNGKPTKVVGVFPQGIKATYEVVFSDGSHARCNGEHLWAVKDGNRRKRGLPYTVKTLQELVERGIKDKSGKNKWSIPLCSPDFPDREYLLHPYLVGAVLGDGYLTGTSPAISIPDNKKEIHQRISGMLPDGFRLHKHDTGGCPQYTISRGLSGPSKSIVISELDRLGLRVKSDKKRIPEEYFFGSRSQRLELLQGLMDTDGGCRHNRSAFYTTNRDLAKDVQTLVWSLGGTARLRTHYRKEKSTEYHVSIKMDACPFSVSYKAESWKPSSKNGPKRLIESVALANECEHVCISVAADDKLYVTRDYVVTHNTIQAIGIHNTVKSDKVLIVCPASLKVNWKREFEKWDVHGKSVGIAQSVVKREHIIGDDGERLRNHNGALVYKVWTEHEWPETDVVVINYDMLDAFDSKIKEQSWSLLICDEAHLLKTKTSLRTMCVFGGTRKGSKKAGRKDREYSEIDAERSVFLTGTPILSKPIELWALVRACDPSGLGRRKEDFQFDYCGAYYDGNYLDDSGASNLEELNRLLRERFMVRRDKRAVLKELPDKRREVIVLPQDRLEAPVKHELTRMEKALEAYENLVGIDPKEREFRYIGTRTIRPDGFETKGSK